MSDDTMDLSLLDKNIEDIEDLVGFELPPKGTYIGLASMGTKKIGDANYVTADVDIVSTVELVDKTLPPPKDGTKVSSLFQLGNEYGEGNMKKFLAPFKERFGETNLRKLVTEIVQNQMISFTLDHRADKKDKEKIYPVIKNVALQG